MGGSNANPSEVSWDDKWAITFLVMYDITGKVGPEGQLSVTTYKRLVG